jgi:hypothetical protein
VNPSARGFGAFAPGLVLAATVGCTFACGSSAAVTPMVRVAGSVHAQRAFEQIDAAWAQADESAYADLENSLRRYLQRFPADTAAPLVRAYLAIHLVRLGRTADALREVDRAFGEPEGATRDLYIVVRGHGMRKARRPLDAIELMQPLAGKIIDPVGRAVLMEEMSVAAVEAKRDFEALGYFNTWLAGTPAQDRERVKLRIVELLKGLPASVLLASYTLMRAQGRASRYTADMQRLVFDVLGDQAQARSDSDLARFLLDGPSAAATDLTTVSVDLRDLAASTKGLRTVSGRTIGLLLPGGSAALRDEAAEVARGVSWALGLPRARRDDSELRLVTRDSGGNAATTEDSLEQLAGEGAGLIVAGFDEATAARALAWGDATGISVLSLVPPPVGQRLRHGFVVGEREQDQVPLLAAALAAHGHRSVYAFTRDMPQAGTAAALGVARVAPCTPEQSVAGTSRFPIAELTRLRAGMLVAASFECLRDLSLDIGRYDPALFHSAWIGATLESGNPSPDPRTKDARYLLVAAGKLPFRSTDPGEMPSEDLRNYVLAFGAPPTFWSALGRDAGILARTAVSPLPGDVAKSDGAIYQRRALVEAGLLASKDELWSTDEHGFDSDRTLRRQMRVVEVRGGMRMHNTLTSTHSVPAR